MGEFLHLEYDGYQNKPDVGPEYRMLFEEAHYSLMLAVGIKVIGRERGLLAYMTREDALDMARAIIDRWGEEPMADVPFVGHEGKPEGDGWELVEDASPTITAPDGTEHYDFVHKGVRYQGPLVRDARLDGIRGVWVRSAPDT